MNLALALLAANVAAVYLTIAGFVVPKITLTNADRTFELIFRAAAISFFVGCGFSHIHIAVHAISDESPAALHQVWMHVLQVIGGWLFIYAALRFLDIRVERRDPTIADLEQLALRDPLTGAFNRRAFDTILANEVAEHDNVSKSLSLLMLDVDNLKGINDEFGHTAGDEMLRSLVTVVNDAIRPTDTFARLGGDEFGLILPATTRIEADAVVDQIRHGIASSAVGDGPEFSVSVGVATTPDDARDPSRLEIAADQHMYADKRQRKASERPSRVPAPRN